MKIIITGATGFVGQNLSVYLQEQQIQTQNVSLRSPAWTADLDTTADAIIHLAGKAHDTTNITAERDYFRVNRDLTIALFDEFLNTNINDFFFFSSVKAVADTVDGILFEDVKPKAITPYGQSKLEAEAYLLSQ